jgi:magnesium-dependent phosphatase-1
VLLRGNCKLGEVLPPQYISNDTVYDNYGHSITLLPEARHVLDELHKRGIYASLNSTNYAGNAIAVLQLLGIWDWFTFPMINTINKGLNCQEILRRFKQKGVEIKNEEVIYVDTNEENIESALKLLPGCRALKMHRDIFNISDLLLLL